MPLETHYSPRDWTPYDAARPWCGSWTYRPARLVTTTNKDAVTCRRCRRKIRAEH